MSAEKILDILDYRAKLAFPWMNPAKQYLAACRLDLFGADDGRWLLAVSLFGFVPRMLSEQRLATVVEMFGDVLPVGKFGRRRSLTYHPVKSCGQPIFEEPTGSEDIRETTSVCFMIRNKRYIWPLTARDIDKPLHGSQFARMIAEVLGEDLFMTPTEIAMEVGGQVRPLFRCANWQHPDIMKGEKPSDNATFRSIARVLATGDLSEFNPGEEPNSTWRFWPDQVI